MPRGLMQAVYYRLADGTEPVDEFIDALPARVQVVLDNQIRKLNRLLPSDPPLAFPHSSQVEGDLRELRCHYGARLYRILYHCSHNLFILLHIFSKATSCIALGPGLLKSSWPNVSAQVTRRSLDLRVVSRL
jgi:phage-related protein